MEQIQTVMAEQGYKYLHGQKIGDPGQFVLDTNAKPSSTTTPFGATLSAEMDARGRPTWVDPATLAQGERITAASGTTFVGGTPTASGEAQYAVTISQNINKKLEKLGEYRWVKETKKDANGNWVAVYRKELRPAAQRFYKNKAKYGVGNPQPKPQEQQTQQQQSSDFQQLVTLRATYG